MAKFIGRPMDGYVPGKTASSSSTQTKVIPTVPVPKMDQNISSTSSIETSNLPVLAGDNGRMNKPRKVGTIPGTTVAGFVNAKATQRPSAPVKSPVKPSSEWGSIKTDPAGRRYQISTDGKRTQFLSGKNGSKGTKAGTGIINRNLINNQGSNRRGRDR